MEIQARLAVAAAFAVFAARAEPPLRIISLDDAIARALAHHPTAERAAARQAEAQARVELARAGYLPQLDVQLQINRATANLVRGAAFPMKGTPFVTGPVQPEAFNSGAFGTVASLAASWDVLGLVARMASVDVALREQEGASAGQEVTRLQVAFNVADHFLGGLARREGVRAAVANEERAAILERTVEVLVRHELRPGADLARARAEHALASTQLIRAEQAQTIAELELGEALAEPGPVSPSPEHLLDTTSGGGFTSSKPHPEVMAAQAQANASRARTHQTELLYLPRLEVVASLWARGSGLLSGGVSPAANGLWPTAPNWAAGMILTWPVLEIFAIRARVKGSDAAARAADAGRRDIELVIRTQVDTARAILQGARRVAENTPIALDAARTAERQATARYQSGLSNIAEVAEAQRLLAQAELDDAVARLGVRTGTLLFARALGDLEPFLQDVRGTPSPLGGR